MEQVLQLRQQADAQKEVQLNEQVAQNAQLQDRVEVLQRQIRNRGNVNVLLVSRILNHSQKILGP